MKTKRSKLDQRTCLDRTLLISGILLLLKFVTKPPRTINKGKTQGVLKNKNDIKKLKIKIINVIILLIEILKDFNPAKTKKPIHN